MSAPLRGLYAITPAHLEGAALVNAVEQALSGGCRLLQYRNKGGSPAQRLREARALARLCEQSDTLFIVNDDLELAARTGAHGVHLGRDDATLAEARRHLGHDAIVGISCYAQWERALAAREAGANYVAFGAFHPSPTKPEAVRAHPALLQQAHRELKLPAVAIGGITPENAQPLIEAGADMVAVIQGLFGRPDIPAAARQLSALFEEPRGTP
jgi:thiamine-phosphate pyrophosphorylase